MSLVLSFGSNLIPWSLISPLRRNSEGPCRDGQPPQQQKDNIRKLLWTTITFLGQLGISRQANAWSTSPWQTFSCTTVSDPGRVGT